MGIRPYIGHSSADEAKKIFFGLPARTEWYIRAGIPGLPSFALRATEGWRKPEDDG